MGRVAREPEATGSDGGDKLTEKTTVPAGLEEEEEKKIKEGEVGSPESDSPTKRKKPSAWDGAVDDDDDANLIRKLREEALDLMEAKEGAPANQPPVKKRKKLVKQRLPKEFIDYMIEKPFKPVDPISQEKLADCTEEFLEWHATTKAIDDKILEYQQALIHQYRAKGYAENEIEVTDDEGDN